MVYDPQEQEELIQIFSDMLRKPTQDGGAKRERNEKPSWKVDADHVRGLYSHLGKWASGELVDKDSGAHPLVHAAWRALAIAWQEENHQFVPRWEQDERAYYDDPALD